MWKVKEDITKRHQPFIINIDLDENLDDENKLTIKGDEQLMKIALSNLIENGCKYSSNQTTNVYIKSSQFGLSIRFQDAGIGIPAEDIDNIFAPFYRGSNTKNIKGHGIGLSMVKGIIKIHGGKINVTSLENSGTTITVSLPNTIKSEM